MLNPALIQLTPDFVLGEFLHGGDPMPPPWVIDNLYRLANRLQVVRDLFGKPVIINSGYRTASHNRAVGGAPDSMHIKGMAADIVISSVPAKEVQRVLKNWNGGLGSYAHFTHVDIRSSRARWSGP